MAWAPVQWERVMWYAGATMSRSQRRRALGEYQAAIVPPIAEAEVVLPAPVAEMAAEAEQGINSFDSSSLNSIPFATVLLRSESASSSQIEALTASARRLSLAILGDNKSPNAVLIARNVRAMIEATRDFGSIEGAWPFSN